jgi:hypothetical protein
MKIHYNWKMLSYGLPVEVSLFLKYVDSLKPEAPVAYDICFKMFKDELLISSCDIENFVYDWEMDNIQIEEESEKLSIHLSEDSESSFDPMAAKVVDFQTKQYGKKKGLLGSVERTSKFKFYKLFSCPKEA